MGVLTESLPDAGTVNYPFILIHSFMFVDGGEKKKKKWVLCCFNIINELPENTTKGIFCLVK